MAVELAVAYVSIIPSMRGMKGQLVKGMAGPAEEAGEEAGSRFSGAMSGVAGKALKAGAVGVAAGFGAALVKGFGRLKAIDNARFKLKGLGHDAAAVEQIMSSANESVLGTAFGLGEAATIAASAVAAGIEPGEELTRTLSLTGDAASIAGTSLGEMGSVFGKISADNRMMTEEMNQLRDRGIPVLQYLQDEFGVTALEARDMVEKGQVDFATFQRLIENNIGGAALKAGESFDGAFANMGAALGRFGAAILGPAFAAAPDVFGKITAGLDKVTKAVGPVVDRFAGPLTKAVGVAAGIVTAVMIPALISWGVQSTIAGAKVAAGWTAANLAAIKGAALQVASVARTVAAWVLAGTQALIHGARMAAGWVLAMGPVGWVTAGIVALVALIVANWDKVTRVTAAMANAVAGWFRSLRERAVAIFTGLKDAVVSRIEALMDRVRGIRDAVTGFFSGAGSWLLNAGREIIAGLVRGITSKIQAVKDAAGRVTSAVKRFLPGSPVQEGPLKVLNRGRAGKQIVEMLAGGIDAKLGMLQSMSDRMASAAAPDIPTVRVPAAVRAGRVVGGDGATVGRQGPVEVRLVAAGSGSSMMEQMLLRSIREGLIRLEAADR